MNQSSKACVCVGGRGGGGMELCGFNQLMTYFNVNQAQNWSIFSLNKLVHCSNILKDASLMLMKLGTYTTLPTGPIALPTLGARMSWLKNPPVTTRFEHTTFRSAPQSTNRWATAGGRCDYWTYLRTSSCAESWVWFCCSVPGSAGRTKGRCWRSGQQ